MDYEDIFLCSEGFLFPFQPYGVQREFMKSLYDVLTKEGIGIFQSPTGTGKSLSILCGALKWLKDSERDKRDSLEELLKQNEPSSTDDWFSSYAEDETNMEEYLSAKEELKFIQNREIRICSLRQAAQMEEVQNTKKCFSFLPHSRKKCNLESTDCESESDDFLIEDSNVEVVDPVDNKVRETVKIFYASKTHSQLLQVVNEFKKSPYNKDISVTCLASRSTLCVNESVKRLKSHSLINEKCFELLRNKTVLKAERKISKNISCPFYERNNLKVLGDHILIESLDIEDLVLVGKEVIACPYYATRNSIPDVEMVFLPYNILLHESTRESFGIKLKNNVVIIDEAHNLLDAINGMYSSEINGLFLQECRKQLDEYYNKYKARFSPQTVRYICIMQSVLSAFLKYLHNSTSGSSSLSTNQREDANVHIIPTFNFLCETNVDHINFVDLVQFCENSHIANKLHGFISKQTSNVQSSSKTDTTELLDHIASSYKTNSQIMSTKTDSIQSGLSSAFSSFVEFLKLLTLPFNCGKVICSRKSVIEKSYFKYLHLNPAVHFTSIVAEAKSIILAGGTMSPISDFVEQLLIPAGVVREKIFHHSFGHVVAESNVSVLAVRTGRQNVIFDFTYESRHNATIVKELGNSLLQIAKEVPGGVVCFFPSYSYEQFVYSFLEKEGLLSTIEKHKAVFREPKESNLTEELLNKYSLAITDPLGKKGAILFSVVGGKLSEGINFSDDLCRCVIMIGLPYPKKDKVCVEKLSYLKQFYSESEDNYTVMCMKAVNQSIGRSIRHKNDYAVIVLLDYRYCRDHVLRCLTPWLATKVYKPTSFNAAVSNIKAFFNKLAFIAKEDIF